MKRRTIFLTILLLVLLSSLSHADIGRKPTIDVKVLYDNKEISDSIFYGKMLACFSESYIKGEDQFKLSKYTAVQLNVSIHDSNRNCTWAPTERAWVLPCEDSECSFGYNPPVEFKIAIYIPSLDKVFISENITRTKIYSAYELSINSDGSTKIVETTYTAKTKSFLQALVMTLILELITALIIFRLFKINKKFIKRLIVCIAIADIISLPIIWFVFPLLAKILIFEILFIVPLLSWLLAEILVIIFEAYFIAGLNKKAITLKQSFILSVIMNLVSAIIGSIILYIIF